MGLQQITAAAREPPAKIAPKPTSPPPRVALHIGGGSSDKQPVPEAFLHTYLLKRDDGRLEGAGGVPRPRQNPEDRIR